LFGYSHTKRFWIRKVKRISISAILSLPKIGEVNRILFLAAWLVLGNAPVLGQTLEEKAVAVQQANAQLN
jgi:hypothetical protein